MRVRRANNTAASRTGLVANNVIGAFTFLGFDNTSAYLTGAQAQATATETWSTTASGTKFQIFVTPNTTTGVVAGLTIDQDTGLFTNGATGSSKGSGTINTTGYYLNGQLMQAYPGDSPLLWLSF